MRRKWDGTWVLIGILVCIVILSVRNHPTPTNKETTFVPRSQFDRMLAAARAAPVRDLTPAQLEDWRVRLEAAEEIGFKIAVRERLCREVTFTCLRDRTTELRGSLAGQGAGGPEDAGVAQALIDQYILPAPWKWEDS